MVISPMRYCAGAFFINKNNPKKSIFIYLGPSWTFVITLFSSEKLVKPMEFLVGCIK